MFHLSEKSPTPDLPDFIRCLVRALDAMHRDHIAHGAIQGDVKAWLSDDASFNPGKFRANAVMPSTDETGGISVDISDFTLCAKRWISGSEDPSAFRAAHHSGKGIPMPFLNLLEHGGEEDSETPSMSAFLESLKEESESLSSEPAEPLPQAVPEPQSLPVQTTHTIPSTSSNVTPISIAFPNGTVGKPYQIEPGKIARAIAAKRNDNPELARIERLQLPEDCGLVFDLVTGSVSGIPTKSFDSQLHLDYTASPASPSIPCKVSFLVNPDPISLWKDLPTNPDAPYQKESLDHNEFNLGDFRVIAASRRGRSHANRGDFRDDDFAVGHADSTGWLVVAVADGAGSAKYSRQGSRIASTVARDWLVAALSAPEYADVSPLIVAEEDSSESPPQNGLTNLLYQAALLAHHKIRQEVDQPSEVLPEPATIRNYDTTLILLIMKKLEQGVCAATFSIGDGGAGILNGHDAEALTHSDGGEHAGQTTFVTIPSSLRNDPKNIANRFNMAIAADFTAAIAMTDGITDPKFPSDAAFADPQCWHALWNEVQPAANDSASLLEWMNFFSPGNHDDRTLVVVTPAQNPQSA